MDSLITALLLAAIFLGFLYYYNIRKKNRPEIAVTEPEAIFTAPEEEPEQEPQIIHSDDLEVAAAISAALYCYRQDKEALQTNLNGGTSHTNRAFKRESNWARTARYESHKKL